MTYPTWRALGALLVLSVVACSHAPEPEPEPDLVLETPVRTAPPVGAVAPGDCPEALRRAQAKPDLAVDRVPSPHATAASALPVKSMPASVRRARYLDVRVSVLVDTMGKADMKTFKVIKTTHQWLADSFKTAVAKWSFDPAMLAGCKVPRIWLGTITHGTPPDSVKKG